MARLGRTKGELITTYLSSVQSEVLQRGPQEQHLSLFSGSERLLILIQKPWVTNWNTLPGFGSLSCHMTQFWPNSGCWSGSLSFASSEFVDSEGNEGSLLRCRVWFTLVQAKHLHSGLTCPEDPEVCWFVQSCFLFRQERFSPGDASSCAVTDVNVLSEAWRLSDVCLFPVGAVRGYLILPTYDFFFFWASFWSNKWLYSEKTVHNIQTIWWFYRIKGRI